MTLIFKSIETEDDETRLVFKKEGGVVSFGLHFSNAADKPELTESFSVDEFLSRKFADAIDPLQWAKAAEALIDQRVESGVFYDGHRDVDDLSEREISLFRSGKIIEAMALKF